MPKANQPLGGVFESRIDRATTHPCKSVSHLTIVARLRSSWKVVCPNGTCYKRGGVVCHAINLDERRVTIVQIGFFCDLLVLGLKKDKLKSFGGICVGPSRSCSKMYPILTLKKNETKLSSSKIC